MERREFTQRLLALGVCPAVVMNFGNVDVLAKNNAAAERLAILLYT